MYILFRTSEIWSWKPIKFKNGFEFNQKMCITLYDYRMIRYILIKKMNKSLRNLINVFLLLSNDESESSEDGYGELIPKIETLRNIFISKYALFMSESEIESYLIKLDKLEEKIDNKINRKIRKR